MSDTERVAAICFELSAKLAEAGHSGKAHERIDELVVACDRARDEIVKILER